MKREPQHAMYAGLVHIVYRRDAAPAYKRTLCWIELEHIKAYLWTWATPTCLVCITEDQWMQAIE